VQTGRRDENAHEQQHPPDEGDGKEQDGEEAKRADSPEVVRRDLDELSVLSFDEIMQQISLIPQDHRDPSSRPSVAGCVLPAVCPARWVLF
jgi:hypothetical protein